MNRMNRQQRRLERRQRGQGYSAAPTLPRPVSRPSVRTGAPVRGPGEVRLPVIGLIDLGRLWPIVGITAGVVLIIGIIVFVVWRTVAGPPPPEKDQSPKLPGVYYEDLGRLHLQAGQVFNGYNSNPPTSGPHDPRAPQFKIYNDPLPKEQVVHGMEHGAVVIWYNCTNCQETIDELKEIVRDGLRRGRNLIMTPYPDMEPATIALTAWTRLDKFPVSEYSRERVERFIKAHDRRFNPEGIQNMIR